MFLDSKKAAGRLKNPRNILNTLGLETGDGSPVVVHKSLHNGGRRNGNVGIPIELQTVIGVMGRLEGPKSAAETFGVSMHHAQELSNGVTSYRTTAHKAGVDPELQKRIEANVLDIRDKALVKTLEFIGLLDERGLKGEKPRDIASIAKDMAIIAEKVGPRDTGTGVGAVVFYAPNLKSIDQYETIDINPQKK